MLKQSLIALGVLAFAGYAVAADITNPFYLPSKGQIGSITSIDYTSNQQKSKFLETEKSYHTNLSEELQYGLTDNLTLIGNIGNIFDKLKEAFWNETNNAFNSETDTEDQNINWEIGLAWNILANSFKLQASLLYGQNPSTNRFNEGMGEYKYVFGKIKAGYQFEKMLPYVELSEQLPIGQKKSTPFRSGADKPVYSAKIGLYQGKCNSWGLDTGIRYMHDKNTDTKGTAYIAEAEASYYLTEKTAISVYGTYALDGKAKMDTKVMNKSAGVRLRWFF